MPIISYPSTKTLRYVALDFCDSIFIRHLLSVVPGRSGSCGPDPVLVLQLHQHPSFVPPSFVVLGIPVVNL